MKFLWSFSEGSCQWPKYMHKSLRRLSLPRKNVIMFTDLLNMTLTVLTWSAQLKTLAKNLEEKKKRKKENEKDKHHNFFICLYSGKGSKGMIIQAIVRQKESIVHV